jgi:hypothetical protein
MPKTSTAVIAPLPSQHRALARFGGLLAPLLASAVLALPARATSVTVGGQSYDLTLYDGSYSANSSFFDLPANGGRMPWWNDQSLAEDFAAALLHGLNTPPLPTYGPLFAFDYSAGAPGLVSYSVLDLSTIGILPFVDSSFTVAETSSQSYAILVESPPTASTPAPLPILGAAAAFRSSLRLRRRLRG